MPFSDGSWDAARARRQNDASAYCRCCLADLNEPGAEKVKSRCKLPVRYSPGGPYVKAALRAAAGALQNARGQGVQGLSADKRKAAARRLVRLMAEAGMTPGEGLIRMAGR